MKRIGAVALVVSVPFVAPASQAIEYAATKTGDAVVDGGKRVVEDGVDMVQNFYQGIKDFFER